MPGDQALKAELLSRAAEDQRLREKLVEEGTLFRGYHPEMAALQSRNGEWLEQVLDRLGWPGKALVGEDGAAAAWLLLQHAIGQPRLLRRALPLLRAAAERGEVEPRHIAMLEDRICFFERRPQRYGTQYDWDENGEMSPWPIEDPEGVDERRRAVGLDALAENTRRIREWAARSGEGRPGDREARLEEMERWARRVGWRD
jgi:hypothetical protein